MSPELWSLAGAASRWALFAGILAAVGAVVFKVGILRRPAGPEGGEEGGGATFDPSRAAARIGCLAVLAVLAGMAGRLAAELAVFRDPFEPLSQEAGLLIAGTSWGRTWLMQACAAFGAIFGFALASRHGGRLAGPGWGLSAAGTALLACTPAFSGHAAGAEHFVTAALSADLFHVLAGGAWLGALGVMTGVAYRGRRHAGAPLSRSQVIRWITAFSPIAMGSAAVIVVTGVFAAWLHLGELSSLWTEPYGRYLALKLVALAAILVCGRYNWKRARRRVAEAGEPARLPASVLLELAAGAALLLVTAFLVSTPPPAH